MERHSHAAGRSRSSQSQSQSQSPSHSAASASATSFHRKRKLRPSSDEHAPPLPRQRLSADDSDSNSDEDEFDDSSIRNFTAARLDNAGSSSVRTTKIKLDSSAGVKVETPEAGKDGTAGGSGAMVAGVVAPEKEDASLSSKEDVQNRGAYISREESLRREEDSGRLKFICVSNDGKDEHMVWLIGLKNIFSRQLPNMPKEYIVGLVMDRCENLDLGAIRRGRGRPRKRWRDSIRQDVRHLGLSIDLAVCRDIWREKIRVVDG